MTARTESTPSNGQTNHLSNAVSPRAANAIAAGRERKRSRRTDSRADAASEAASAKRRAENSIQPAKRRVKPSDAPPRPNKPGYASRDADNQAAGREQGGRQASSAKAAPEGPRLVPEHVRKKFVQVGKHYYFADGARAFTDRGGRLTTPRDRKSVV